MTDFDRRTAITMSVTGAVLASCSKSSLEENKNKVNTFSGDKLTSSLPPQHGRSVTETAPDKIDSATIKFAPNQLCVIVIDFSDDGILASSGTYKYPYADKGAIKENRIALADLIFEQFDVSNNKFANIVNKQKLKKEYGILEPGFGFSDQCDLYIYLRNKSISFHPNKSANIIFSEKRYNNISAEPNNAFVGLDQIRSNKLAKKIVYLENWFVDQNGTPIYKPDGQDLIYAMNIVLLFETRTGITKGILVLDPDTGNGGGHG